MQMRPPLPIRRIKSHFLHIWEAGVLQRVSVRPSQLRPELFEELTYRHNLFPHIIVQFLVLRFELLANLDNPTHNPNMKYRPL